MPNAYFTKVGSRPLRDQRGRTIPFQDIGDDTSVLQIDSEKQREWFTQLMAMNGRLGVLLVSEQQFEEVKKNCSAKRLRRSSRPAIRIDALVHRRTPPPAAASAVVKSDPVEIPNEKPKKVGVRRRQVTDSLAPVAESANTVPPIGSPVTAS